MSVTVPVSTVEKPLTAIDFVAALDACRTQLEVGQFSEQVPAHVRADERFCRAVAAKLLAIKKARKRA